MRNLLVFAICTASAVAAQPSSANPASVVHVPFVGCRSDGQTGPVDAPSGDAMALPIAAEAAQKLAYYQAEGIPGVLAPRGWYCFAVYGSGGGALYISPQPIDRAFFFSSKWNRFNGPVVEIVHNYGDTSGRFVVATMIARVFPAHRAFVRNVLQGDPDIASFPSGPYPKDRLTYKSKEIVEYQTPAQTEGLGTVSRLEKNTDPVRGVAILTGSAPDLVFVAVRLPRELNDLLPSIIQRVERETRSPHPP